VSAVAILGRPCKGCSFHPGKGYNRFAWYTGIIGKNRYGIKKKEKK